MPRGSTRSAALYDLRNRQPPPAIQGTRARFARAIGTTWIADAHARSGRRERSPFILAFVVAVWHAPLSRWKESDMNRLLLVIALIAPPVPAAIYRPASLQ